jgi:hypothetical protein
MSEIEIDVCARFIGGWLAQHFDRASGDRYSIGEKLDGSFFVIVKRDCDERVTLEWFRDAQAVCWSELPAELKRAVQSKGSNRMAIDDEIPWTSRSEWNHAAYSLNVRLYKMADAMKVAEALAAECRQKWGREPDISPRPDDWDYFRKAGFRRPRKTAAKKPLGFLRREI